MKYAAAITLYNPESGFVKNLINYTRNFPLVIVNDNSRDNSAYVNQLKENSNLLYIWDGRNWGLPSAFNRSLVICEEKGIDFLCTLDQDSKLGDSAIKAIEEYIDNHDMAQIAIVAPKPIKIKQQANSEITDSTIEVPWVICSGAFINVRLLKVNNIVYDEAYFVDRFDADLSWQIQRAGLKQLVLNSVEMPHACGDDSGHSPLRNYYIFRNRFYFNKKYYNCIVSFCRTLLQTIRHCWSLVMYQKDGMKKIKMLPFAISDYRKGLMGEVSSETYSKIVKITEK